MAFDNKTHSMILLSITLNIKNRPMTNEMNDAQTNDETSSEKTKN